MAAVQTPPNQIPREDPRKEESRREEQEKRAIENDLRDFDAHGFYDKLLVWSEKEIVKPYKRTLHINPFRVKQVLWQPMPLTRNDIRELEKLSTVTAQLLSLLRLADQKGLECPYIHQLNRQVLEKAIHMCDRLKDATTKYLEAKGFFAWIHHLFNRSNAENSLRDLEYFRRRLEAISMMCHHQEFAQDLIRLRREVTYRTGNILKDDSNAPQPARMPVRRAPRAPQGLPGLSRDAEQLSRMRAQGGAVPPMGERAPQQAVSPFPKSAPKAPTPSQQPEEIF